MPFPEYIYTKIKDAILRCAPEVAADVYAISFFIEDLEDDPRRPTLILSYNTNTYWHKSIAHASNADEAKWNFAFWPQTCEAFVGNMEDSTSREEWIKSLGLWYSDQDEQDDFERTLDLGDEITRKFLALAGCIAKRLHDEGIILQKFIGAIPILIHELEYYLEIAQQTERANPTGYAKEFSNWIDSLYK
jgi:hypothetical protein